MSFLRRLYLRLVVPRPRGPSWTRFKGQLVGRPRTVPGISAVRREILFSKRRKINAFRFVGLLMFLIVVCASLFLLHAYQSHRSTTALLNRAKRSEAERDVRQATRYFSKYLTLVPGDVDAVARFALLSAETATSQRTKLDAAMRCDRALRQDPSRNDIRRHLTRLWLACERYADAAVRATELCELDATDAEAWTMLAQAHFGQGKFGDCGLAYKEILKRDPANVDAAFALATVWREKLNSPRNANQEMDAIVKACGPSPRAYLARYVYRLRYGMEAEGDADLEMALELAPTDPDVLLAAADRSVKTLEYARAIELLEQGRAAHPGDVRFFAALGRAYFQQGEKTRAIDAFRRGLELAADNHDLHWRLALVLIDEQAFDEAETVLARMRQLAPRDAHIDFLQARIFELRRDMAAAAQLYEAAAHELADLPELQSLAHYRLAECYRAMDQSDLALAAFRRATQIDPRSVAFRMSFAQALEQAGRLDDATAEYEKLSTLRAAPPELIANLARARLTMLLRQPAQGRVWGPFDEFIDRARSQSPRNVDLAILKAQSLVARGQRDAALAMATDARDGNRQAQAAWLGLAAVHRMLGNWDEASAVLAEASHELGDVIALRLARAEILASAGKSGEAIALLEHDLDRASADEQATRLRAMVRVAVSSGEYAAARRILENWRQAKPGDVFVDLALADLSLAAGDAAAGARQSEPLKRLGGSLGTFEQFARARELYFAGRQGDAALLREAKSILEPLKGRRPNWPQVHVLLGLVEESLGNADDAIRAYGMASELGESSAEIVRRHVRLLGLRGRYQEINGVLERMKLPAQPIDQLRRFATAVSLRAGNIDQAVRIAEGAAESQPDDYRNQLWLGQLLRSVGRVDEAEQALVKATLLGPEATETWAALVQFYAAAGRSNDAQSAIERAKTAIPVERGETAIARYFELARMPAKAEAIFDAALRDSHASPELVQTAADFYYRNGQIRKAEKCSRRALAINPDDHHARARLAWIIANQRKYATWHEAVRLIDQNLESPRATADDTRIKAVLLAMRPNAANRAEAIRLITNLEASTRLTPEDRFLLARLYFYDGQPQKGRERMTTLLNQGEANATLIATYVEILLEHREVDEAAHWLGQLEVRAPKRDATVLRARLLDLEQKPESAIGVLRQRMAATESATAKRDTVGLLSGFGWSQVADDYFHEIAGDDLELLPALALWRRTHGQVDAALDVCRRLADRGRFELAALVGIAVVHNAAASAERIALVEDWLARASNGKPQDIELELCGALLEHLKGNHDKSIRRFQSLLAQGADPVRTMNNLAWVTSEGTGQHADALRVIDTAIERFGPVPTLLDTRGVVLTRLGRYEEAIADLEAVVSEASTVSRLLHLATACFRAGRTELAQEAIGRLESHGPALAALTDAQRAEYSRVKRGDATED